MTYEYFRQVALWFTVVAILSAFILMPTREDGAINRIAALTAAFAASWSLVLWIVVALWVMSS